MYSCLFLLYPLLLAVPSSFHSPLLSSFIFFCYVLFIMFSSSVRFPSFTFATHLIFLFPIFYFCYPCLCLCFSSSTIFTFYSDSSLSSLSHTSLKYFLSLMFIVSHSQVFFFYFSWPPIVFLSFHYFSFCSSFSTLFLPSHSLMPCFVSPIPFLFLYPLSHFSVLYIPHRISFLTLFLIIIYCWFCSHLVVLILPISFLSPLRFLFPLILFLPLLRLSPTLFLFFHHLLSLSPLSPLFLTPSSLLLLSLPPSSLTTLSLPPLSPLFLSPTSPTTFSPSSLPSSFPSSSPTFPLPPPTSS